MQIYYNSRVSFSLYADIFLLQGFIFFICRYISTLHKVSFSLFADIFLLQVLFFNNLNLFIFFMISDVFLFLLQLVIFTFISYWRVKTFLPILTSGFYHKYLFLFQLFIGCIDSRFRVSSYFYLLLLQGFIIFFIPAWGFYHIYLFHLQVFFLTSGFYYIHHVFLIQGFIIMYHFRVLSYIHVFLLQGFIKTIPDLIEGLDKIRGIVNTQRKITQAFGEGFDQCESCG